MVNTTAPKNPTHIEKLSNALESAGKITNVVGTNELHQARQHVGDTLKFMENAGGEQAKAFSRLKPKQLDGIVRQYSKELAEGVTHAPDHLTKHLTETGNKQSLLRRIIAKASPNTEAAISKLPSLEKTGATLSALPKHAADFGKSAVGTSVHIATADMTPSIKKGGEKLLHGAAVAASATTSAVKATGSAVGHSAAALGKGSVVVGKYAGKALLVGGVAAAGLYMLSGLLRGSNPPRRLENVNDSFGDTPVVFNPGAKVDVGSMAVPQVGQQAQMGNFAQQVQSGAQDMGAQVPTR